MRGKLHEQRALVDAGFIVIFFHRKWNQMNAYGKTAMLVKWWPFVLAALESAAPGQCFEIPFSWRGNQLKEVKLPKRKKPGARPKDETHGEKTESQP